MKINCSTCGKEDEKHAKGLCYSCYKKQWKNTKVVVCKRCQRSRPHHAFGYCASCHGFVYHYDKILDRNAQRGFNLGLEQYRSLTRACLICGFDKVVDLHHLDHNRTNNSVDNLVPLCPNHHKMLHKGEFHDEIEAQIQQFLKKKR